MRQSNDAFTRMRRLREALLQTLHSQPRRLARAQAWQPALDLIASEDAYLVRLDVPGVKREQVQASLEDGVLRVRGTVERAPGLEGAQQLRLERVVGPYRALGATDGGCRQRTGQRATGKRSVDHTSGATAPEQFTYRY